LELDHQQLPLLIEMEEYEFMESYLKRFIRKPRFVYRVDESGEFETTRVREWDPESHPVWCRVSK
jgi:DNA-binding PadR family transcriptional regulator